VLANVLNVLFVTERKRPSSKGELPDFKNRPGKVLFGLVK